MSEYNDPIRLLEQCERERLHLSGAIQPYGVIIAFDALLETVTHASANISDFCGTLAEDLLGLPVGELAWLPNNFSPVLDQPGKSHSLGNIFDLNMNPWNGKLIRGNGQMILELERVGNDPQPISVFQHQVALMSPPKDEHALVSHNQALLEAFRATVGYDRMMIYRFQDDWSGEVIAEIAEPGMASYLGLHFPASDIPAIARSLYMINPSRLIPDAQVDSVPIIGKSSLDLTWSDLRSVSQVHLQYLSNMGVRASFSVPIRVSNNLWGLVACHHHTPKLLSQNERLACISLTNTYSLALAAFLTERRLRIYDGLERRIDNIIEAIASDDNIMCGVEKISINLIELMHADGLAIVIGCDALLAGDAPNSDEISEVDDWFMNRCQDTVFLTNHLEEMFPGQVGLLLVASGMAAIKAHSLRLYWFRHSQPQTVAWAGNPHKLIEGRSGASILSPRRSFEQWIEIKSGYSMPWNFEERMAATKIRAKLLNLR